MDKRKRINTYATKVKRLRLLLQAGAPLGAVEQKANLEGVDIQYVLHPNFKGTDAGGAGEVKGLDKDESIPETLMKKYTRMIKAGVPVHGVCQLAGLETGLPSDKLAALLGGKGKLEGKTSADAAPMDAKAGVPPATIQNSAMLQGCDLSDLNDDSLGIKIDATGSNSSGADVKDNKEPFHTRSLEYFTILDGKVSFPPYSPLTKLVLKMVQTIEKTAMFDGDYMVVDNLTLFHALGTLKGVQFARDECNSTVGHMRDTKTQRELVQAKRHGFSEMAHSLGVLCTDEQIVNISGLDELVTYIECTHKEEIVRSHLILKDGLYDFASLHLLYPPGSFVLSKHAGGPGIDSFVQVLWNRYISGKSIMGKTIKSFQLSVRYIVPCASGKATFAEVVERFEMFEGTRSLASDATGFGLPFVLPSEADRARLLQLYIQRGEKYNRIIEEMKGKKHAFMEYKRGCFFQKRGGHGKASVALASTGRIILDFDGAAENGHCISIGRDDMVEGLQLKLKEYKLHMRSIQQNKTTGTADTLNSASDMIIFSQIPYEYLPLVWPSLVGFSLTSKAWGDVLLDGVKNPKFDPDIFDRLVLPDSRKRMIKALIKHTNAESGFHDLVAGKGEGTIFLLYGEPGNGKTLTAEAVAENLHRPLYSVSMGTLGTTADELERRLSEILLLSSKWNALVLLDEADSFLEARSLNSSLERNAMVSVMLRLVEYYQGILFLTSNRIEAIDPAFQTRITLALRYECLDLKGRAAVWENLLEKSGFGSSLDMIDVEALAMPVLNGREIKNALRLAMAMAADQGVDLSQELLLETAEAVNGYKDSMKGDWFLAKRVGRNHLAWVKSYWRW